MVKRNALGKGIESLIQKTPQEILSNSLRMPETENHSFEQQPHMVSLEQIYANPDQPRKIFKEQDLKELADSIKENGIIQPLIVAKTESGFQIIAGERRYRAAKLANLEKVPVVVRRATEKEKMVISIIENVQRADLNCIEEALAYYQLMSEYNLTQEEVAKKVGKDRSTVANFLRLLKLSREVIELVQRDQLSFGHAKILCGLEDKEFQKRLANIAVANNLSVRELEKLSKQRKINQLPAEEKDSVEVSYSQFKDRLEKKTGFHFDIKAKKNGSGSFILKFSSEPEFNDILSYLLK